MEARFVTGGISLKCYLTQAGEMKSPGLDELLLRPSKVVGNLWGKIKSRRVSFRGFKVLLNSLGNNSKCSMICTNWYEITHSA